MAVSVWPVVPLGLLILPGAYPPPLVIGREAPRPTDGPTDGPADGFGGGLLADWAS